MSDNGKLLMRSHIISFVLEKIVIVTFKSPADYESPCNDMLRTFIVTGAMFIVCFMSSFKKKLQPLSESTQHGKVNILDYCKLK